MSSCWRIDSISTWVTYSVFAWAPAVPNAHALRLGRPSQPQGCQRASRRERPAGWSRGLQVPANRVERGCDCAGECEQRRDDESCDHGQDNTVLGHRLAVLDTEPRAKVCDEMCERHCVIHLPFGGAPLAWDSKGLAAGIGRDWPEAAALSQVIRVA